MKAFLGVDPGVSGAVAVLDEAGCVVALHDWAPGPSVPRLVGALTMDYQLFGALERVHAFRGQGVVSSFSFGAAFGWWQGCLDSLEIPWRLVEPQRWQAGLVPKKDGASDKPGLTVARRLYPGADLRLAKHHNRADALLIAHWLRSQEVKSWTSKEL